MSYLYNKTWFKVLVWFNASFFFFLSACVLIASMGPSPTIGQIERYMAGMMSAMGNSMMGLSMQLEAGSQLTNTVLATTDMVIPLGLGGLITALVIRYQKGYAKKIK